MSIDSLTKRVARLEGGVSPFELYMASQSEADGQEMLDALTQCATARSQGAPEPDLNPALRAKLEHLTQLVVREGTRQP